MKTFVIRIALSALPAILVATFAFAQQPDIKSDSKVGASATSAGEQVFSSMCASCHGLDGRGAERGPNIATRPEVARLSDSDILRILRLGVPGKGMPPFAALGNEKINAVLKYLRSLQGSGATAPVAGDAALGKKLFHGKAGCAECHMINGSGGFLGPELSSYARGHSVADIQSVITHPETNSGLRQTAAKLLTKDGQQYEGVIRNEDNFSIQLQSADGAFHLFAKADLATVNYRRESLMPADYGSRLTAAELDALVAYLVRVVHEESMPGSETATPAPEDEL